MKLVELFESNDYLANMQSYIVDLLISMKEQGMDKVYLHQIRNELNNKKYYISKEFLAQFLEQQDMVDSVDLSTNEIKFASDEPESDDSNDDKKAKDFDKEMVKRKAKQSTLHKDRKDKKRLDKINKRKKEKKEVKI